MIKVVRPASVVLLLAMFLPGAVGRANEPLAGTAAAFFPGGMLGVQLGSSWNSSKKNRLLLHMICETAGGLTESFDEVCFFGTAASSQLVGARVHDGFIVRKGDRVVLIGTGISINDADDPLARVVMQGFQSQIHARFQQSGADVLFMNVPERRLSTVELAGLSSAPVLLVELALNGKELAVLYGYLAPVKSFSALTSD